MTSLCCLTGLVNYAFYFDCDPLKADVRDVFTSSVFSFIVADRHTAKTYFLVDS